MLIDQREVQLTLQCTKETTSLGTYYVQGPAADGSWRIKRYGSPPADWTSVEPDGTGHNPFFQGRTWEVMKFEKEALALHIEALRQIEIELG